MDDTCTKCSHERDFNRDLDVVHIHEKSRYNCIQIECPECGHRDTVLTSWHTLLLIISARNLQVVFHEHPSDQLKAVVDEIRGPDEDCEVVTEPPGEEDVPRDWLFELYNSMRHMGGECGPKCLFPECG